MVGDGSDVVVLGVAGRHLLWIEVFGIDEVGVLRARVKRGRDDLFWRCYEIELRKRINVLLLGFVVGEGQGAAGIPLVVVDERGVEVETLVNERAAEKGARRFVANAAHVPASNAEIGEGIVELGVPFFAATARFDGDYAGSE